MSDFDASIDGSLLRLQREARGWTMTDMAMRSCLSIKQIRQLEEGGSDAFYSDAVKLTAAKKVGSVLGLSSEQVLTQPTRPSSSSSTDAPVSSTPSVVDASSQAESVKPDTETSSSSDSTSKSTSTSVWVMVALFAAALLVAAWMNPSAEPVVTEAAPPLQTLPQPADASDPASSPTNVMPEAASSAASH